MNHHFQTPPEFANYMASLVPKSVKTIFEPTPGEGNLVKALEQHGFKVLTPLANNFFYTKHKKYDAVVMNPPFSNSTTNLKGAPEDIDFTGMKTGNYFLDECMKCSNIVIAIMPWYSIIDSDVRMRKLMAYGIKSITALPRRTFKYIRVQTAVFYFEKGYKGTTQFLVYDLLKNFKKNNTT